MTTIEKKVDEILQSSVDFHVHSHMSPSYHWDLMEIGRKSVSAGICAVIVKNLYGSSHEQCHMANKIMGMDMFYATLVLGKTSGGIRKAAVEEFVQFGGNNKIVEMPVFDSARHLSFFGKPDDSGINVFENDRPAGELLEILEIIARYDLILKTGHISPRESIALIRIAKEAGIEKIVVTHATGTPVMASIEQQVEMASMGALIEHCVVKFLPVSILRNTKSAAHPDSEPKIGDMAYLRDSIRKVGPHHCILGTDSGQTYHPYPHELFRYFIYLLLELGFSYEEIGRMARENPCRLLGIGG
jgi:predicted TIM-barrel fold metal-dependent hydrolase